MRVFIPRLPSRFDPLTKTRVPTVDVTPAATFGELVTLFRPETPTWMAIAAVNDGAVDIGPDDYVLAVGDVTLLAVVIARALRSNGRVTVLRWDNDAKNYRAEEIRE